MKKTVRNLVLVLLLLVTLKSTASDELDLKVSNEQNLIVEAQNIGKGAVLSLHSENGDLLFKDRFINEESYSKILDFTDLLTGTYILKLDREFSISTSIIKKTDKKIRVDNNSYSFIFKPLYKISEDQVSLYFANPQENKVEIEIFDKFGVPVGIIKCNDLVVKRKLDFSKVKPGKYTVEIKTKTGNFTNTVIVG